LLVKPTVTVALRCPACGIIDYHDVGLFAFSGNPVVAFDCACGRKKMTLSRKKGRIWMEMACALCEETHLLSFSPADFWSPDPRSLFCSDTEVEVGFMGNSERVRTVVQQHQDRVDAAIAEAGLYDFFEQPDVMYEVLHYLRGWAEGGLLSCPCGNHRIEVNIHPDRLELQCQTCGRYSTLAATSWRDVEALRSMEPLEVKERGRRLFPDS